MTLKKYLEENKFAEVSVSQTEKGVSIEFALISRKKEKKWIVSTLTNDTLSLNGKNIEDISEEIVALAIQKLNFELTEKNLNELQEITRKIEVFENESK